MLVLCGEKDHVNKKAYVKLVERLSRARFGMVDNAGYEVNMDNPKGLAKAIQEELDTDLLYNKAEYVE